MKKFLTLVESLLELCQGNFSSVADATLTCCVNLRTSAFTGRKTPSYLPAFTVLKGAKIDQVSEHRLLGITIDNKLRWDSHINDVCKTVSRRVLLLPKLRYIADIDTRKLFFIARIKPHIDYVSVVWDGCSDVLKKI